MALVTHPRVRREAGVRREGLHHRVVEDGERERVILRVGAADELRPRAARQLQVEDGAVRHRGDQLLARLAHQDVLARRALQVVGRHLLRVEHLRNHHTGDSARAARRS